MVAATYDITKDPNYPYHPFPGPSDPAPGALQLYNAVYSPMQDTGDVTGDTFHDPTDPTRDNPATTQSFGDMLRDTIAEGRDLIGGPNWGTAVGTALGMMTGTPAMGTMIGTGVHQFDISEAAREGDSRFTGSGIPSQQIGGALAQAAAAGRMGMSSPVQGSWMGMFDSMDKPSNDAWAGLGDTKSDQLGGDYAGGNYGGSMDKGAPSDAPDGKGGDALYRRGGSVGALKRAWR